MQPTSTNGQLSAARETLDAVRQLVEKLEGDLQAQQEEIKKLRAERDEAQAMFNEMKRFVRELPEWEKFDPAEYRYTFDDIIADIRHL